MGCTEEIRVHEDGTCEIPGVEGRYKISEKENGGYGPKEWIDEICELYILARIIKGNLNGVAESNVRCGKCCLAKRRRVERVG